MADQDIALMAHLMRRAGFGAGREELETRVARGYEATVEDLVDPKEEPYDRYEFLRLHPEFTRAVTLPGMGGANWLHAMIATKRPLEEKMVLLWHHLFATGQSKVDHYNVMNAQIDMFRDQALGNYRDLLVAVAKRPGDDLLAGQQRKPRRRSQRKTGAGSCWSSSAWESETTRRTMCGSAPGHLRAGPSPRCRPACTAASTGSLNTWNRTMTKAKRPSWAAQETSTAKKIIDIICEHPATARFVSRHLYNYFVADEAQVPGMVGDAAPRPRGY